MTKLIFLFLFVLANTPLTEGIRCYRCVDIDHVRSSSTVMENVLKNYLQTFYHPNCEKKEGSSDYEVLDCKDRPSTQTPAVCTSGDVKVQVNLIATILGADVPATVSMGLQYRTCIRAQRNRIKRYGCQDAAPYTDFIRDFFTRNITDAIPIIDQIKKFDLTFTGGVCLCNQDQCNMKLPPDNVSGTANGSKVSFFVLFFVALVSFCNYLYN